MIRITVANLVKETDCSRGQFGRPRRSTLLDENRCADLYIVVTEYMDPRSNLDRQFDTMICEITQVV